MIPKTPKVQKAKGNLKCWMVSRVNRGFDSNSCGKIAVWQLCRETQPLWNSHDSWWPELKMFGSMPWCSFPWHKLLPRLAQKIKCCTVYSDSLNLIHEFTSLFSPKQLRLLLKWILIDRWRRPSMLSSMCQHVARLQFDSCIEKDSLCGTVMMAWT